MSSFKRSFPAADLVKLGLEKLAETPRLARDWGRVVLLCNQASVDRNYVAAWDVLRATCGERLVSLLSPQHGLHATVQDNMIETGHSRHPGTGLPVYSLYSETREPTPRMLEGVDTIVIDLQITGCRVYTFKYTIAACLRAAKKFGKKVVVLDRPNPLGGEWVGGRVLEMNATSFVGEFPIPMRHGLTPAEAASYFNVAIQADLEIIEVEGWQATSTWDDLGREWIITSPNLPTLPAVHVYPGTVMLEGTNLSEGRGTGLPFQFVGAPYLKSSEEFAERVRVHYGKGDDLVFRPTEFQPTSQKWQGEVCRGIQIHVREPKSVRSFDLGLAVIRAGWELSEGRFQWKQPPYEYDYKTLPIKLILGTHDADARLTAPKFAVTDAFWKFGCEEFVRSVEPHLRYPRRMRVQ